MSARSGPYAARGISPYVRHRVARGTCLGTAAGLALAIGLAPETAVPRTVPLDLEPLTAGRDFRAVTLPSIGGTGNQFGYSVACTATPTAPASAGLAFSAFEADRGRGRVYTVTQRALEAMSVRAFKKDLTTIRPAGTKRAWFGHEVDIADVTGDRRPDLLVGARYARKETGAAYFLNGRQLRRKRITASRGNSSVLYANTSLPRELGFSVGLVPATREVAVSMTSGRNGSRRSGAVARIAAPRRTGLRPLPYEDFLEIDPPLGQDFGRVIDVDGPRLLLGSYANPRWTRTPYQPSRAWISSRRRPRETFESSSITGRGARHLSFSRLRRKNVYGLVAPWRAAKSGIAVERSEGTVLMTHAKLRRSSFAYALDTRADVNGDGFPEIIAAAPEWTPSDRRLARGAVVVINGRDALTRSRVRAAVLQFRGGRGVRTVGSKRRLCVQQQRDGAVIAAGAPYGRGALMVARVTRLW